MYILCKMLTVHVGSIIKSALLASAHLNAQTTKKDLRIM